MKISVCFIYNINMIGKFNDNQIKSRSIIAEFVLLIKNNKIFFEENVDKRGYSH